MSVKSHSSLHPFLRMWEQNAMYPCWYEMEVWDGGFSFADTGVQTSEV